jgi:hypothetical protein
MAEKTQRDSEPTEQLTVRIEPGLVNSMKGTTPKGVTIGHIWSLAARLWLSLPTDVQLDMVVGRIKPEAMIDASRVADAVEARTRALQRTRAAPKKSTRQVL